VGLAACTVAGAIAWLGWPSAPRACSCLPPKPPVVAARESYAVFEGTTSRPVPVGKEWRYTFQVTRVLRGHVPSRVEIYTIGNSAMCARRFEANARYLVYAYSGDSDRLYDNSCTRTRLAKDAQEDYDALGFSRTTPTREPAAPELTTAPTTEPPRIEGAVAPPPQTPAGTKRGCRTGEMPHDNRELWIGLLLALGIAGPARRILG
jgi:hypothetical protein